MTKNLIVPSSSQSFDIAKFAREGMPWSSSNANVTDTDLTSASFSGAGFSVGGPFFSAVKAYAIKGVLLSANKNCKFNLIFDISGSSITGIGTYPIENAEVVVAPGVPVFLPIDRICRGSIEGAPNAYLRAIIDSDKTHTYASASWIGYEISDDLSFEAAKTALFIGDSLWNGTGPTTKDTFMPWLITNYYKQKGVDVRMLCRCLSGSTTAGHETLRSRGALNFPISEVAAIFYQLSTNDAIQAISTATVLANMSALAAWKQKRHPTAKLVIVGPPPLENNTNETALGTIRTAFSGAVTTLADPNIKYVSLAGAFDRTVEANYVSSDTAGSKIHPNDTGLGQIWNGGYSGFGGLKAWLDTNLPTI